MATDYTEFERHVADLYRALGADVRHDVEIAGSQVDVVVVERTTSGFEVISAVECKYYSGTVGVNQVAEFAEKFADLRRLNRVHAGLIVTEGQFSPRARDRAAEEHIGLLEVSERRSICPLHPAPSPRPRTERANCSDSWATP